MHILSLQAPLNRGLDIQVMNEFNMPNTNKSEIYIFGEIQKAIGFEYNHLIVQYFIDVPNGTCLFIYYCRIYWTILYLEFATTYSVNVNQIYGHDHLIIIYDWDTQSCIFSINIYWLPNLYYV